MSFSDGVYSSWRTKYEWYSNKGLAHWHAFEYYSVLNGFTSTVYYRVVARGASEYSISQNCYLKVTANGTAKVYESPRKEFYTVDDGYDAYSGTILLEGSFTVDHNYDTGKASFAVQLKSAIYYKGYQCDESTTLSLPTITITPPSITDITDNGNNTITVKMDWSEILTGGWGYCCIGNGYNPTMDSYTKRVSNDIDLFSSTTINLSDLVTISHGTSYDIRVRLYQWHNTAYKGSTVKTLSVTGYAAPNNPTSLSFETNNKNKKYTPTSTLTLKWKASDKPDGFRLRVYKNGSLINLTSNKYLDMSAGTPDSSGYYKYNIKLSDYGYIAGDTISFTVFAYNENGKSTPDMLWSGNGWTPASSSAIKIVPDIEYTAYAENPNDGKWYKVIEAYAKNPNDGKWYEVKQFHGKYGANKLFYSSKS